MQRAFSCVLGVSAVNRPTHSLLNQIDGEILAPPKPEQIRRSQVTRPERTVGRRNLVKRFAIACIALFWATIGLSIEGLAQVNATVGGTVSDTSGALIPGVEVTAKNVNTGISETRITNESGSYSFASL